MTYTGTEKTVTVTLSDSVSPGAMGAFDYWFVGNLIDAGSFEVHVKVTTEGTVYTTNDDILMGSYDISRAIPAVEDFIFTEPANLTYDGTDKTATVVVKSGITGMGAIDDTIIYDGDRRNVGSCTVKINVAAGTNYTAVNDLTVGSFYITPATPTENEFDIDMTPKNYDGTVKEPSISLKAGITGIGTYTIDYSSTDHVNAGQYSVMINVNAGTNYSNGNIPLGLFIIQKAVPTAALFNVAAPEDREYDGTEKTATVTLKSVLEGFGDFSVDYDDNVNAGTCRVTVDVDEGMNYSYVNNLPVGFFEITKAIPAAYHFDIIEPSNLTYNGSEKTVTVTLKQVYSGAGDIVIHYSGDRMTAGKCINAGDYDVSITLTPGDNFEASGSIYVGSFTVLKADPVVTAAPQTIQNLVYNGGLQDLVTPGTASGGTMKYVLSPGTYSSSIPKADEPGQYEVYYKVFGDDNYKDGVETGLPKVTIDKKTQVARMNDVNYTYSPTVSLKVQVEDLEENPSREYSVLDGDGVSVDPSSGLLIWLSESERTVVKVVFGETAHYKSGNVTCSVKTIKADSRVSKPTANNNLKYNGNSQNLVTEGTVPSGTNFEYYVPEGSYGGGTPTGIDAGYYHIQCNYRGGAYYKDIFWTDSINVRISEATLPGIPQKSFNYNGGTTYTESGFSTGVNGETVTLSYFTDSKNAGTYSYASGGFEITYSGTQNYVFGTVGDVVIKKAGLPDIGEKKVTYGGLKVFTTTNFSTGVNGEKVTLTYTAASQNAGTYIKDDYSNGFRIEYSGPQNYEFAGVGNLVIEKATIQNIPQKSVTYNGSSEFTAANYPTGVLTETVNLTYRAYSPNAGTYIYSKLAGPGYFTLECSDTRNYELGPIGNLLIGKLTPTVYNFSITPPGNLVYDGTAKVITAAPSPSTVGLGEVSSIRYTDNVNVGTCYVTADVMEGTNYTAYNGIQLSTFSIVKATNSVTDPTISSWTQGGTPSTPSGATAKFGTPYYMYSVQSAEKYSKTVPTTVGKYYVKAVVDGTVNYDSAQSNRVAFEIKNAGSKSVPTQEQFVISPTSFTYDGTAKTVSVNVISGVKGMGTVDKIYYSDNVNVGKCSVSIDVSEGTSFTAVKGLYVGSFDITAAPEPLDNKVMYIIIAAMVVILVLLAVFVYNLTRKW